MLRNTVPCPEPVLELADGDHGPEDANIRLFVDALREWAARKVESGSVGEEALKEADIEAQPASASQGDVPDEPEGGGKEVGRETGASPSHLTVGNMSSDEDSSWRPSGRLSLCLSRRSASSRRHAAHNPPDNHDSLSEDSDVEPAAAPTKRNRGEQLFDWSTVRPRVVISKLSICMECDSVLETDNLLAKHRCPVREDQDQDQHQEGEADSALGHPRSPEAEDHKDRDGGWRVKSWSPSFLRITRERKPEQGCGEAGEGSAQDGVGTSEDRSTDATLGADGSAAALAAPRKVSGPRARRGRGRSWRGRGTDAGVAVPVESTEGAPDPTPARDASDRAGDRPPPVQGGICPCPAVEDSTLSPVPLRDSGSPPAAATALVPTSAPSPTGVCPAGVTPDSGSGSGVCSVALPVDSSLATPGGPGGPGDVPDGGASQSHYAYRTCPECRQTRSCSRRGLLEHRLRRHVAGDSVAVPGPRPCLLCPESARVVMTAEQMRGHALEAHGGVWSDAEAEQVDDVHCPPLSLVPLPRLQLLVALIEEVNAAMQPSTANQRPSVIVVHPGTVHC